MRINFNSITIFHIIFFSLLTRIVAAYFFADITLDNEWNILTQNLETKGVLGFYVPIDEFTSINKIANINEVVLPSVFMPPLYAYFIFFFKIISNNVINAINLIIFTQILLSLLTIYFFYKILKKFLSKKLSLVLIFIFSFFPLYIYSATQISSVTLQIFLSVLFFYYLLKFIESKVIVDLILFSIVSGLSILIRGEFILFYFFALIYFFLIIEKNFKFFFISVLLTIITISPYLKRNFDNFNTIVLTKSFGYNLLKGNNKLKKTEGSAELMEDNYNPKKFKILTDNNYEIKLDNIYKDIAIKIIAANPIEYLVLYFKKIFSFLFISLDSTYKGYYNFFHIFPKIIISLLSFIGGILSLKKKGFFQFIAIYYFLNACLFSVFFILPRYGLMFLPVKILLSLEVFKYLKRKFIN